MPSATSCSTTSAAIFRKRKEQKTRNAESPASFRHNNEVMHANLDMQKRSGLVLPVVQASPASPGLQTRISSPFLTTVLLSLCLTLLFSSIFSYTFLLFSLIQFRSCLSYPEPYLSLSCHFLCPYKWTIQLFHQVIAVGPSRRGAGLRSARENCSSQSLFRPEGRPFFRVVCS